jgi:2'-5' RNA ligase
MRLFSAVDLDDGLRAHVQRTSIALRQRLERIKHASRVSWVSPDRMHLTLLFIGEVSDAIGSEIVSRFGAPLPVPPFDLRVGAVGLFPPAGRPRVIWLGIESGLDQMRQVHEQVVHRLEGVEFAREARAFSPHLTLARFHEPGTVAERQALTEVVVRPGPTCPIDHVTLYQSRLSPKGPTYTALRRAPLAGTSA